MKTVSDEEVVSRIRVENPWWESPYRVDQATSKMPRRAYFDLFFPFVVQREPKRALILMGPRRVGKTVILHQTIQALIDEGTSPNTICYLDLQTPLYNGLSLEKLLTLFQQANGHDQSAKLVLFFDEIQYLPGWEVHLKNLVDRFPSVKFIASGSAAAALRLKSVESGAGRFTDFLLPPVTFYEYLQLREIDNFISIDKMKQDDVWSVTWKQIADLNRHFFDYLNFGGYPEAIFSEVIQADPGRYIRSDIVDKVLMKDLPSLYGIQDVQELNSLFTTLAYNTAGEVSLDALATHSGISKNTIKRYIEYLESSFLIKTIHRIDRSAKRFSRANFFKVYLTNPCIRRALFSPIEPNDQAAGSLVETAVFAQWFHSLTDTFHYARWDSGAGEVDLVKLSNKTLKPVYALEVKWSDRCATDKSELKSLRSFLSAHPGCETWVTTETSFNDIQLDEHLVKLIPCAVYCYFTGWKIIKQKIDSTLTVSYVAGH